MNITIIGSGAMGAGIGTALARAGHSVTFTYSRDAAKLAALAAAAGPDGRTATVPDAVRSAAVIFFTIWPGSFDEVLNLAGDLSGKVLITCSSALTPDFSGERMGIPSDRVLSVAEELAARFPGAHVVEAFNLTFAEVLHTPDRTFNHIRPSLPYCGDDPDARQIAARLIEDAGYHPIDAGPLYSARMLETLATAWVQAAVRFGWHPQVALAMLRR